MTPALPHTRRATPIGPISLVIVGLICQDIGASFAVLLFPAIGALGMVALRLGFSAIILLAISRPTLRGHSLRDWLTVVAFGVALAGMNGVFYEALARIPLGAAVTIEVLGPLVLSVIASRRASSWLWAILAFAGVALLGRASFDSLDPLGVLFAVGAAVMWALYIVLSARTGARFPRMNGLAIAMAVGAILALPFGIFAAGPVLFRLDHLLLGLAVAVLSSTIPYALELRALRRIPAAAFSVLMSLSPAIATLAGFVVLGQRLTVVALVAIGLVIVASIGAVLSRSRSGPSMLPTDPLA
ncbi:EamA family transporter [soil metagenome]